MNRERMSEAERCVNTARPLTPQLDPAERGLAVEATQACSVDGCGRRSYCRTWCDTHYNRWRQTGDVQADRPIRNLVSPDVCTVDGCETDISKIMGRICRKHYYRWSKYGSWDLPPVEPVRVNGNGYPIRHNPGHPLANLSGGRGLEHRMILFDAIGDGAHPCAYCGKSITWRVDLTVDHVNHVRSDNKLENLVPACQPCNSRKANDHRWGNDLEESA